METGTVGRQICEVCWLVDKDDAIKDCTWCTTCKAWICRTCEPNLAKRAKAMMKRTIGNVRVVGQKPCQSCGGK